MKTLLNSKLAKTFINKDNVVFRKVRGNKKWEILGPYGWEVASTERIRRTISGYKRCPKFQDT